MRTVNDAKRKFIRLHDIIFFYSKSDIYTFSPVYKPQRRNTLTIFTIKLMRMGVGIQKRLAADQPQQGKETYLFRWFERCYRRIYMDENRFAVAFQC